MIATDQLCTFTIGGYLFGIAVHEVQEIIRAARVTRVPLAPAEVAGLLNVRGELVTAIDLRERLALPARDRSGEALHVVLATSGGAMSLVADSVGEVISVPMEAREPAPPTLRGPARELVTQVAKLEDRLVLCMDAHALTAHILRWSEAAAA